MATGYDAFISYSHAADGTLAPALQTALQGFATPLFRRRSLRLFRDQTSLALTPELWPEIQRALAASRYFLLLASPDAAGSPWVQQEVSWWLTNKPANTLLIVQTGGPDLRWDRATNDFDWACADALPPNLKGAFDNDPLRLDLRWTKEPTVKPTKDARFLDAVATVAATLRGVPKDELIGEDLRQHRQKLRLAWAVAAVLTLLVLFAFATRYDAEQQATIALARALTAEAGRELDARNDERAALLAREAYRFSNRAYDSLLGQIVSTVFGRSVGGAVPGQVDKALREALTVDHMSHVLPGLMSPGNNARIIAFTPDGQKLVVGRENGAITLWDLVAATGPTVLVGRASGADSVAFSLDGQLLVAKSETGAMVWDLIDVDGAPTIVAGGDATVDAVAVDSERQILAASSRGDTLVVWEAGSPTTRSTILSVSPYAASSVAFSPEARVLATSESGDAKGSVRLWDVANPEALPTILTGFNAHIVSLEFSPDGQLLVAKGWNGVWGVWNIANPSAAPTILSGVPDAGVSSIAFGPDGRMLAAGSLDGVLLWTDWANTESSPTQFASHTGSVTQLTFRPDGKTLATAGSDGTVRLWNLDVPAATPLTPFADRAAVTAVAFHPNGKVLAAGSGEDVLLWDLDAGETVPQVLHTHPLGVSSVAFSPDGRLIASSGRDGVQLSEMGDLDAGSTSLPGGCLGWVDTVAFNPNGNMLATTCFGGTVGIRKLDDHTADSAVPLGESAPGPIHATSAIFSPDGQRIAVGGDVYPDDQPVHAQGEGRVWLWDVADPVTPTGTLVAAGRSVTSVAFSPDGQRLVAGSNSGIVLWNVDGPSDAMLPTSMDVWITSVTFSPDGTMLAAGSLDGRVWLLDVSERLAVPSIVSVFAEIEGGVPSVAFNPNGRSVVTSVTFSPDGRSVAAAGWEDNVRIWIAQTEILSELVCATVWRNLRQDEWNQFIGETVPYEATCPGLPSGKGAFDIGSLPA
jgi:WD40 repeat protein